MKEQAKWIDVEKKVLGAILREGEMIETCFVYESHFLDSKHKRLMKVIRLMQERNEIISLQTIVTRLYQNLKEFGGFEFFTTLESLAAHHTHFTYYQNLLIEFSNKRKILLLAHEVIQKAEDGAESHELLSVFNQADEIESVEKENGDISELLNDYIESLQTPRDKSIAKTGFKEVDRILLGGYKKTQFVIIGARPGVGKTAFALNQMKNVTSDENNVAAFFSCEMDREQLLDRLTCMIGNVLSNKQVNPTELYDEKDYEKALYAVSIVSEAGERFRLYDKTTDVNTICYEARQLRRRFPNKTITVFVDYLQLLSDNQVPKHFNRTQTLGGISRKLKLCALDNNVTIVALAQLNREVEKRANKRPTLADLRESGDMEQDADIVSFLYQEDEPEMKNVVEYIIAKHRAGAQGVVKLAFLKEYFKFADLDTHH